MSPYRTRQEPDSEVALHLEAQALAKELVDLGVLPWWSSRASVWFERARSGLLVEFLGVGRRERMFLTAREFIRELSGFTRDPLMLRSALSSVLYGRVAEHFAPLLRDIQPFQRLALSWFERVREHRRRTYDLRCAICGLPVEHTSHVVLKVERERTEFSSTVTTTFRCPAGEDG